MATTHSQSAFQRSCVIQPRHPQTKLPTTVVERQSLDFTQVTNTYTSSDEEEQQQQQQQHKQRRGRGKGARADKQTV